MPQGWLVLAGITRNNLVGLDARFPLGVLTAVTGVSGSGKSSLVSEALVELVCRQLGHEPANDDESTDGAPTLAAETHGHIASGMERIQRLVRVDQKPIGRTPRSNLATYTGLFDGVRKLFAATPMARSRRYDAGRFSFNVAKGRCDTCEGEGFVSVELLFMPSVYAPCPTCHGARYNAKTLEVTWRGRSIADVLGLTVEAACEPLRDEPAVLKPLAVLRDIGLGYLRLGQPATELSGGEAQRIKLATELQKQQRGRSLYVLDEPTTGLHPADVDKLMAQLQGLVDAGNTVIVVEHDERVIAAVRLGDRDRARRRSGGGARGEVGSARSRMKTGRDRRADTRRPRGPTHPRRRRQRCGDARAGACQPIASLVTSTRCVITSCPGASRRQAASGRPDSAGHWFVERGPALRFDPVQESQDEAPHQIPCLRPACGNRHPQRLRRQW
jgi:energy-coupling factor transporter ATP-binding protein EcfA2